MRLRPAALDRPVDLGRGAGPPDLRLGLLTSLRGMPQNVPSFEFSDRAKQVRAFVFEFWCEHGRGPTLRE